MRFFQPSIEGLLVIEPEIFQDERGYFCETYNKQKLSDRIPTTEFVQDNQSLSKYGTIRGLHLQRGASAQAKLVRVISGEILDVAVDVRPNSKTFGQHYSVILSGENKKQLFIPRGFAHGFSVLSREALFQYKCDNFYHKESEDGIVYNDSDLRIDWKVPREHMLLSEKDKELKLFKEFKKEIL